MTNIIFLATTALILQACSEKSANSKRPPRTTTNTGATGETATDATTGAGTEKTGAAGAADALLPPTAGGTGATAESAENFEDRPVYLYIAEADATLSKEVKIAPSGIIAGMNVPRLEIKRKKSDYVQVLRCAASYNMVTLSGEEIRHVIGRPNEMSELEWAWAQAKEDRNACKIVGLNVAVEDFADLTAPKGEFYYIINPCVGKENSLTRQEGCSNNISLSNKVTVRETLRKELRDKATELANAESSLNANIESAISLARKIEIHLRACEDQIAHDTQAMEFKKGMIQLGMLVVGGAIGFSLPGIGGANGAVMVGQLSMMLGSQLLFMKVLNWPPAIANECIDPNVVATTAAQRKKAAKNDPSNMAKNSGKYEAEFQVQTLTRQLQALLDQQSGPIAKDTQRVQQILEEMKLLDIKVLTVDQAKAQVSNLGVDITKPESFSDPGMDVGAGGGIPGLPPGMMGQ